MKTEAITHQQTPLTTLCTAPNPADTALVSRTEAAAMPVSNFPHHPSWVARPRNGKVARLPKPVRDVVNRMLSLNISQEHIVSALDEIGIQVTQQNISNWKIRGGYREWCLAQEHATQLRLYQDNLLDLLRRHSASELPEVGLQAAATQLSQFFLTPDARALLATDPREYERRVSMLARISAQLKPLQKSRDDSAKALSPGHDPDRIRAETHSELERLTETFTSKIGESANDPVIPHRNLLPAPAELFDLTDCDPDLASRKSSLGDFISLLNRQKTTPNENTVSPAPAPQPTGPEASRPKRHF